MKKLIIIWLVLIYSLFGASDVDNLLKQLDKASKAERIPILIEIADSYWLKDRETAVNYYKQAISEAQVIGSQRSMGDALFEFGRKLYFWGELDSSSNYLQQSLEIRSSIADSAGIGKCLSHLGLIYCC